MILLPCRTPFPPLPNYVFASVTKASAASRQLSPSLSSPAAAAVSHFSPYPSFGQRLEAAVRNYLGLLNASRNLVST